MNDILLNLIVLAVLLVIGGGVFLVFRKRKTELDKRLDQAAKEHGWKLQRIKEPLEWGVHISHPDWRLEAISQSTGQEPGPGSSNVSMHTLWQADRPGSTVMLGPRTQGSGLDEHLLRPFVQLLAGEDLSEVPIHHPELQKTYMLRAVDPAAGEALLNPFLESALLDWKKTPPLIRRDRTGISMAISAIPTGMPAVVTSLYSMGTQVLAATPVRARPTSSPWASWAAPVIQALTAQSSRPPKIKGLRRPTQSAAMPRGQRTMACHRPYWARITPTCARSSLLLCT